MTELFDPSTVTVAQVDAALTAICEQNPDRVNPRGPDGVCVYTGHDGSHCLIGEYLAAVCGLPIETSDGADVLAVNLGFRPVVAQRLDNWQDEADDGHDGPRLWGDVPEIMADLDSDPAA